VNQSTIEGSGNIANNIALNNGKTRVINANQSGAQFYVSRMGASTNKGLIEATDGGQLVMGSIVLNNTGGRIRAAGAKSYVLLAGQGAGNETFSGGTWTTSGGGIIYCYDSGVLLDGTANNTVTNSGSGSLTMGDGTNNVTAAPSTRTFPQVRTTFSLSWAARPQAPTREPSKPLTAESS
jgi:hypothetical protein